MTSRTEREEIPYPIGRPSFTYPLCDVCRGKGEDPNRRKKDCPKCNGSGRDTSTCGVCRRPVLHGDIFRDIDYCDCIFRLDGTLVKKKMRCKHCRREITDEKERQCSAIMGSCWPVEDHV